MENEIMAAWSIAVLLCCGAFLASRIYTAGVRRGIQQAAEDMTKNMAKMELHIDVLATGSNGTAEISLKTAKTK